MLKTARSAANRGRSSSPVAGATWKSNCAAPVNSYNNHVIAFTTAATIPIMPAKMESMPTNPPRTLAREAEIMPMSPNAIATMAKTKPSKGPVTKLRMAATMAIIANTLNFAGAVTCCSMIAS